MSNDSRSERERVIAESGILCVYGDAAPSHGCACCNCTGVVALYDAAIDAAAKACEQNGARRDDLLMRYKRDLEGLTPGGSEFVNDPEFCARWLRDSRQSQHDMIIKLTKRVKELETR